MNDARFVCGNQRPSSGKGSFRYGCSRVMPRAVGRVILFAIFALLLQLGVANVALPMQAFHPAGVASLPHDSGHSADGCPDGSCTPKQCDMGAGANCHCFCTQIPLESVGDTARESFLSTLARVADVPGTAPNRLVRPFRPPAQA